MITHRLALPEDSSLLGEMNWQLIQDEGHRNPMSVAELTERMTGWLASDYHAVIFLKDTEVAAYALYRKERDHIYLRQFFVQRHRRREGIGRECLRQLSAEVWPQIRVVVEVLSANAAGAAFWRAVGFADYAITLESRPQNS